MRHFSFLPEGKLDELFFQRPKDLGLDSPPGHLATALGATLYSPATRPNLVQDILRLSSRGCFSMVICLEDSVPDDELHIAEQNVVEALTELYAQRAENPAGAARLPMIFLRPRSSEQLVRLSQRLGAGLRVLSGFAIPKFEAETNLAQDYFDALGEVRSIASRAPQTSPALPTDETFWLMPILESPSIIHQETRIDALRRIFDIIKVNRNDVLAVRIGATDFSSAFGLRRSRDLTIYDVKVVSSVISDIVNILGRPEDSLVISGPVWEHFDHNERVLRPLLRATPFAEAGESGLRERLLTSNMDNLIREITLDQANGLLGKTVIHPSHLPLVHAMSVVSHEEYSDAVAICGTSQGGATASPYSNKMNEQKPHRAWAEQILRKADVFGVSAPGIIFVDLLEASMQCH